MSKILLLSTAYLPLIGGSELAIKEITDRLANDQFDLVTARYRSADLAEERIGRVNVFRVGRGPGINFFLPKAFLPLTIFFKVLALLRSGRRYDLIHVWQASQAGGAAWLLKLFYPRWPLVLTMQEGKDLAGQPWSVRIGRSLILSKVNYATVISRHLKDYLKQEHPQLPSDIIPNGVDEKNFMSEVPNDQLTGLREGLGLQPEEKVVISVSRLVRKNGLDRLIEAVAIWQSHHSQEKIKLFLIGEGEEHSRLQLLTAKLNLTGQVRFVSTVENRQLLPYLKLAQVFVRPSRSEGLGTAFLEALAAGVPIIGSARGGITDFLKSGETGLVCDPDDPQDIALQIGKVLEDQPLRQKLIRQGQALVRANYLWDNIARQYGRVYNQILAISKK